MRIISNKVLHLNKSINQKRIKMNTLSSIIETLKQEGIAELGTEDQMLTIRFRTFFSSKKEFHFELNCKAIASCKTEKSAINKIENFLNQGFQLEQ